VFWQQLVAIVINHPMILDEYLWLLMLNEHFLDYQATARRQVEQQLALWGTPMPAVSAIGTAAVNP
jgi:hypothetical protein